MRVLLTGSTGWLGRHLAPMLRATGHEVTGLDVAPGPDTQVVGTVADRALVGRTMSSQGIEGVIHAAALHKPDIVRYPRQAFVDVNVTGTLNLLEEAAAAGVERFVFTSTTSLMITQAIRDETAIEAMWLDETSGPLSPRNIYGVTKRAAEELCRLVHGETGLPIIVLRTARFFPEDDDTHRDLSGENMKANEFLNRRLTVEDCAAAHIAALDQTNIEFGTYIVSAPTPFAREEAAELKRDARAVIARHFPGAADLYAARGWTLPASIGRVYDAGLIERELEFGAGPISRRCSPPCVKVASIRLSMIRVIFHRRYPPHASPAKARAQLPAARYWTPAFAGDAWGEGAISFHITLPVRIFRLMAGPWAAR